MGSSTTERPGIGEGGGVLAERAKAAGGMLGGRSPLARYGAAAAAVGVAAVLRGLVSPVLGAESPFLLFVVAVIVAAWLGGGGPGLFATGLAALVGTYLFLPPQFSLRISGAGSLANLGDFR